MTQIGADKKDMQSYAILGAAMEVHSVLGRGFLESVYQHAFALELTLRAIPYVREASLAVMYKGQHLPASFRAAFLCFDRIIVELKAQARLMSNDDSQIINYLKASSNQVGLLLNFGSPRLEYRRLIYSENVPKLSVASASSAEKLFFEERFSSGEDQAG